ncbi:MAG: hypothetical protein KG003_01840, partial [Bacteroidetes bacterium]|nr:hypothetical protein [Bacteroidota bacterium]
MKDVSTDKFLFDQFDLTKTVSKKRTSTLLELHFELNYAIENKFEEFCDLHGIICGRGPHFEKQDYANADYFRLIGVPASGYPQPEHEFLESGSDNYELSCQNRMCWAGKIQRNPFILSQINHLDKLRIFESNWIFDDIFMKTEIYTEYFKPLGLNYIPVMRLRPKSPNPKIVQLDIPILDHEIENHKMTFAKCEQCGNKIYDNIQLDYMPLPEILPKFPIWKTKETFFGGDRVIIFNKTILEIFKKL